jgi:Zn-dependent peptidase ImmA (M78 family)
VKDSLELQCLEAARQLTQSYKSTVPPFYPASVADQLGVAGIRERLLTCDARVTAEMSGLYIEINSVFPETRRRLSLAHEIGHLILDKCMGGAHLQEKNHSREVEALCNRIAGLLLAPDWAIRKHFQNSAGLGDWPETIRCATLLSAASAFNISIDAMTARVVRELGLAPSAVAVIWRYTENRASSESTVALRVTSVWQNKGSSFFVPLNKTAPLDSVIRRASNRSGVLCAEEDLSLGSLRGRFLVEAAGFGATQRTAEGMRTSAVLSLIRPLSHTPLPTSAHN